MTHRKWKSLNGWSSVREDLPFFDSGERESLWPRICSVHFLSTQAALDPLAKAGNRLICLSVRLIASPSFLHCTQTAPFGPENFELWGGRCGVFQEDMSKYFSLSLFLGSLSCLDFLSGHDAWKAWEKLNKHSLTKQANKWKWSVKRQEPQRLFNCKKHFLKSEETKEREEKNLGVVHKKRKIQETNVLIAEETLMGRVLRLSTWNCIYNINFRFQGYPHSSACFFDYVFSHIPHHGNDEMKKYFCKCASRNCSMPFSECLPADTFSSPWCYSSTTFFCLFRLFFFLHLNTFLDDRLRVSCLATFSNQTSLSLASRGSWGPTKMVTRLRTRRIQIFEKKWQRSHKENIKPTIFYWAHRTPGTPSRNSQVVQADLVGPCDPARHSV